jgi:hypothetical protein
MTRAKPKPTIRTREPAKEQRSEAAPAKVVPTAPPVKSAATKPALSTAPSKSGAAKAAPAVKAAPTKPALKAAPALPKVAPAKVAPAKVAPAKVTPAKVAPAKVAPAKVAPAKVAPAKVAPAKVAPPPATALSPRGVAKKASASLDTKAKLRPVEQAVGVSSDAVARRTGKSWAEWFALLDAAGAKELDHKGIVAVLAQRHGVGPWWQQMVAVAYEQARGKNGAAATDEGFQVDVSKVLELPLAKLFRFWAEPAERNKWLADDRFSIHKATASKSIRARWGRGVSRIDVDFCEKGPAKSQVTVQHNRIETSDAAEQMKAYWAKKIRALEALTRP